MPWSKLPVDFGVQPGAGRSVSRERAQTPTILVVEDESSIASFVSLYLKNAGYAVRTAATGAEALDAGRRADAGADRARPDAAGHRRDRGLQAHPPALRRADPDAHRPRRGHRQDHRARGRRRRLPDEAVQPARARRAREVDPAPRDARAARARERGARARRPADRRRPARGDASATRRSSSRRRSSTCSGSCSTTAASCSRATSCSSASGATRSPATRARSTCTCASCAASSATPRRSSPCGAWATRSRPRRTRKKDRRSLEAPCSRSLRVRLPLVFLAGIVARGRGHDGDRGAAVPGLRARPDARELRREAHGHRAALLDASQASYGNRRGRARAADVRGAEPRAGDRRPHLLRRRPRSSRARSRAAPAAARRRSTGRRGEVADLRVHAAGHGPHVPRGRQSDHRSAGRRRSARSSSRSRRPSCSSAWVVAHRAPRDRAARSASLVAGGLALVPLAADRAAGARAVARGRRGRARQLRRGRAAKRAGRDRPPDRALRRDGRQARRGRGDASATSSCRSRTSCGRR